LNWIDEMFPYAKFYPIIGITARGSFSSLWIHKTYKWGKRVDKYYYPYNPQTFHQQYLRNVFAYAVANWQGFNDNTKNFYNSWAKKRPLSGYNRYISLYVRAYQYNPPTAEFLLVENGETLITESGDEIELE